MGDRATGFSSSSSMTSITRKTTFKVRAAVYSVVSWIFDLGASRAGNVAGARLPKFDPGEKIRLPL